MLNNSFNFKLILLLAITASFSQYPLRGFAQTSTVAEQEGLAFSSNNEQQNALDAAERLITEGNWQDGLRFIEKTKQLSSIQNAIKNILLAKIDLIREQPRLALTKLSNVREVNSLPPVYQVLYHELLANTYDVLGNLQEAIVERLKLDSLLQEETRRKKNRRILWLTLAKIPVAELNTLAVEAPDHSEMQGWMKLALISRQTNYSSGLDILAQVEQWQTEFRSHAANSLLPSPLASIKPYLHNSPRQIALLLPLTGSLSGPGNAIREGFMAAANGAEAKIKFYDTAVDDVTALYQQAIEEGAEYIIGPLTKTDTARVAAMDHPVPTLLLNDIDITNNENAYCFGLSPSTEARQVALKARKKGYSRTLVITPTGEWGNEIKNAFSSQWKAKGGVIADELTYSNNQDLNIAIRDLLHVSESLIRGKKIKQLLGQRIQTVARRREDFDMIFLLAYPSKARQIMPLLRYYFAGNVPVYSTSAVYAGSPNIRRDKDLDGIIFSDMPWVFAHQMGEKNWPEQFNSYNRLYALGVDSYNLVHQLNQLLLFPATGIQDKNGVLYLNRARQIARIPAWGQFRKGVAVATKLS